MEFSNLPQYDEMFNQGGFDIPFDWENDMTGMGYGSISQPSTDLISEPQGPYGFDQSLAAEPPAPTVGQPGRQDEDFLSQLRRSMTGMGVGIGTNLIGTGLQSLMNRGGDQKQTQMAQSTTQGRQYTPEPLEALPGTKASPLISGRPNQVIGSQGLKGKRAPSYGGFSMY